MEYLKIDPRFDEHPDFEAAGWAATELFHLLLRLSARLDLGGRFDSRRLDPRWLAKRWNLTAESIGGVDPALFIRGALDRLLELNLLERDGDGVLIPGWERFYSPPLSGAERTRNWRSKRDGDSRDEARHTTSQPSPVTNVVTRDATPHHSTPHHGSDRARATDVPPGYLADKVDEEFRKARGGTPYAMTPKDELAVAELLRHANGDVEEILRRWRIGLKHKFVANSLVALARNWNDYTQHAPSLAKKPPANGDTPRVR